MPLSVLTFFLAPAAAYTLASTPRATAARASQPAMALPELYVYDHCPFCVRVRIALGVTGVPHKLVFMGNDDVRRHRSCTCPGRSGLRRSSVVHAPCRCSGGDSYRHGRQEDRAHLEGRGRPYDGVARHHR